MKDYTLSELRSIMEAYENMIDSDNIDTAYFNAIQNNDSAGLKDMVMKYALSKIGKDMLLPSDEHELGFKYHRGEKPYTLKTMYAVFNVGPDGFKAAYAGNNNSTPVGVWLDAQNLKAYKSLKMTDDLGNPLWYIPGDTVADWKAKFLDKNELDADNIHGKKFLLQRGGKHGSSVPNFAQMNTKTNEFGEKVSSAVLGALPHNKLIFEVELGVSKDGDLTDFVRTNGRFIAGKNQGIATIKPNQYYSFKTNANANGEWSIAGTFRVKRLVPHEEIIEKTNIANKDIDFHNSNLKKGDKPIRNFLLQKWINGYHPEDFGLTVDMVDDMYADGLCKKLTDVITYDDSGNIIPLSKRFDIRIKDMRY